MSTTDTAIQFIESARTCALQMMSNANYILRELPSIKVPGDLRPKIEAVCHELISTKHDVMSELFELQELVESGADDQSLATRTERIFNWIQEAILALHLVVQNVQKLASEAPRNGLLFFLIIESAANIVRAIPPTTIDEPPSSLAPTQSPE